MTDYEDLQKRCQRGTTSLKEAHDIMAACYGMLGKLGAENAALRAGQPTRCRSCEKLQADNKALWGIAIELRGWASCEHVGHHKGEYHELDEPCKVLARIDAVMAISTEKSQGISRRGRDAIVEAMSKEG